MTTRKQTPSQKSATSNLHAAVERAAPAVRNAVLKALKADVSDAELGRTVRLAALSKTSVGK